MACSGEKKSAYTASVFTPERKRPLVRPRHRWESTHWINQAQDRNKWWGLMNMVINCEVPPNARNTSTR